MRKLTAAQQKAFDDFEAWCMKNPDGYVLMSYIPTDKVMS